MDVLILGTGALATLFAARLSAAGASVTMLGRWREALDALDQRGARLADAEGRETAYPVRAVDSPEFCPPVRFALVLVKSWQTRRAAEDLARCLAEDGIALTLQNGLGNDVLLAEALGDSRVAVGVTTVGATLLAPGLARLGGEGTISLEDDPRVDALRALFAESGFDVRTASDARTLIWGKLVINAAINPLTALLEVPNGELLRRPSARALMGGLARETAAVAAALGIALPFENPVLAAEEVARRTASNFSSMFQDVRRGAPTEIDAICGAISRVGEDAGIPAPLNRFCWQLVRAKAIERGAPGV